MNLNKKLDSSLTKIIHLKNDLRNSLVKLEQLNKDILTIKKVEVHQDGKEK